MELTCIKKMTPKNCHCLSFLGALLGQVRELMTPYGKGLLSGTRAVDELNPARNHRIIIAITF